MFSKIIKKYSSWCLCVCLVLSVNCLGHIAWADTAIVGNKNILKEPSAVLESIVVSGGDNIGETQTATEILQLPHAFRHQQHYAHRIEQAVNDFKLQQQKQQQASHLKERDKNKTTMILTGSAAATTTTTTRTSTIPRNNSTLTMTKIMQQQEQQQHQRRHEHHWLQQQHRAQQQHHLRHRHHYQIGAQQLILPTTTIKAITNDNELDYNEQKHNLRFFNLANIANNYNKNKTTTTSTMPTRRYFDRDGLFKSQKHHFYEDAVTRGPNINNHVVRHKIHKSLPTTTSPRLSLPLNNGLLDADYAYEEFNDDDNDDDDESSTNDDDNLLYNNDDEFEDELEDIETNNSPPLTSSQTKSTIKRYTNPFRQQEIPIEEKEDVEDSSENDDTIWNRRREHIARHYLAQQEHRRELKALIAKHNGNIAPNMVINSGLNKQQHKNKASH